MSVNSSFRVLTAALAGLAFVSSIRAQEFPSIGILFNTSEMQSLVYRCEQSAKNSLDCEFTQNAVRPKARSSELGRKLESARIEYRKGYSPAAAECKTTTEIVAVLEGRKAAPKPEAILSLTTAEKRDYLTSSKAMLELCAKNTEESYVNVVRVDHDKSTRTCKVSSNSYKQTFRLVQDSASSATSWVVQSNPEGPCGIVNLSRFEPERIAGSKSIFWRYIARKAITNPEASFGYGAQCKGLDESQYVYDWRSKEHSVSCDYIEFSPI